MTAMTTTTVHLDTIHPPTSNTLDSYQRNRLMRSTRKLGAVLGTTPYLLEHNTDLPITLLPIGPKSPYLSPKTRSSKRYGSLFPRNLSPSSSVTSLQSSASASASSLSLPIQQPSNSSSETLPIHLPGTSSASRQRKNAPKPLFLRLNAVPVSMADARLMAALPPTPITATPTREGPSTPISPTFTINPVEVRRKRMAKLARTLGEKIPPELVSGPRREDEVVSTASAQRRSMSVDFSGTRQVSWVGEWNRGDMQEVQKKLRALKRR